jgi:transposase
MATRSEATDDPGRSGTAGEEITPQQEAAIVALLERPSVSAAAELAGVGRSTLYEWLQRPDFRAAYREARREALEAEAEETRAKLLSLKP